MLTRWQFSLSSLFVLITLVGIVAAFFARGGSWWILAVLVVVDAIWFCIIAGTGKIDEQPERSIHNNRRK